MAAATARKPDPDGDAVVSSEFLVEENLTRPYGLDVVDIARLNRLVESAPFNPEDALVGVLVAFGDAEKRAAAIAHLQNPSLARWPRRAR